MSYERERSRDPPRDRYGSNDRGSYDNRRSNFGGPGSYGGRSYDNRPHYSSHGRGGGGGGGRGGYSAPRPTEIQVKTNFFEMKFNGPGQVFVYAVRIDSSKRVRNQQDEKEEGEGEQGKQNRFKLEPKNPDKPMDLEISTDFSRLLLDELQKQCNIMLFHDGKSMVVTPIPIFNEQEYPKGKTMELKVRKDDGKPGLFLVTLLFQMEMPLSNWNGDGKVELERTQQIIDVILKSSFQKSGMISLGKNPKGLCFNQYDMDRLMDSFNHCTISRIYKENPTIMPLIGVKAASRVANDAMFINMDSCIDWVNRDSFQGYDIPLLDPREQTIAGIRVRYFDRPIDDPGLRCEIEKKLKNIIINVLYRIPLTDELREELSKKGKNEQQMEKYCRRTRRDKRIREDTTRGKKNIMWGGSTADETIFERRPPRKQQGEEEQPMIRETVFEYYKSRYNLTLKYPHMPLIFIGNKEWYPLEFCYQGFSKVKNANDTAKVTAVLDYNDKFSGTDSIDNINRLQDTLKSTGSAGNKVQDFLDRFNIHISDEAVQTKARVLTEPTLSVRGGPMQINNGSWNLRNVQFSNPVQINSFGVIDLAPDARNGDRAIDFVRNFIRVAEQNHGVDFGNVDRVETLIATGDVRSTASLNEAMRNAIQNAKDYFLYDVHDVFQANNVYFDSIAINESGELSKCKVVPPPPNFRSAKNIGLILPVDKSPPTHINSQNKYRQMYRVREFGHLLDPFEFRWCKRKQCHEGFREGQWVPVTFGGIVFQAENGEVVTDGTNLMPMHIMGEESVLCPDVLFIYLPDDTPETYNAVKYFGQYVYGIPTQCVVAKKFSSQKNRDQYCSNIVLKINGKLSNSINDGHAWETAYGRNAGIPWVADDVTMVIGISIANTMGHDGKSVIAGSVCLNKYCMQLAQDYQVQNRAALIDGDVLSKLITNLLQSFSHCNERPKRILIFRDATSDGSFEHVVNTEVECIKRTYKNFLQDDTEPPPITLVMAVGNHSTRIVPSIRPNGKDKNVPSGTLVSGTITDNQGADFYLTPHGGLKGTSKPMLFRVVHNENASTLTNQSLQHLTYHMSFQYTTATKAVRMVPVLYYSKRLANTVIGYLRHIHELEDEANRNEIQRNKSKFCHLFPHLSA